MKKLRHSLALALALAGFCMEAFSPLVAATSENKPTAPATASKSEPTPPATPISAIDADNKSIVFNKTGRITVVFFCNEQTQNEIRAAAGVLDKFRGLSNFRVIAVVDMRDSLGSMVEGIVRWRMQEDLDDEAERLTPFYRANQNPNDPRPDLCAVPDFKGDVGKSLGLPKVSNKLRCTIYGPAGNAIASWADLHDYKELFTTVDNALKAATPATPEPKTTP